MITIKVFRAINGRQQITLTEDRLQQPLEDEEGGYVLLKELKLGEEVPFRFHGEPETSNRTIDLNVAAYLEFGWGTIGCCRFTVEDFTEIMQYAEQYRQKLAASSETTAQ